MEIKLCDNRAEWDNWFKKHPSASSGQEYQNEFLQSWDWGEFQASTGKPATRLQAIENGEVVWQGQGFEHMLGMGLPAVALAKAGMKYFYLPKLQIQNYKFQTIIDFIKKYNFAFLRIEPLDNLQLTTYPDAKYGIPTLRRDNLQLTKNRQPQTTLILDLSQPEETLLANMHSKTRYNISLAERKGVEIREEKDIDVFWKLNEATIARDRFKSHNKNYYAKMLETEMCRQLTAYFDNKPIAAIILIIFGDTCVYLHGASSNEERNLMAPYLLQWRGIQLAKKNGCRYYDFWGIAPAPQKNQPSTCFHNLFWEVGHRWTGVTRFKAGFGGTVREYPQAVDVVLNKSKYYVYLALRRVLGILKGLKFIH